MRATESGRDLYRRRQKTPFFFTPSPILGLHTLRILAYHPVQKCGGGTAIRTVQELLGHRDISTTMIYTYSLESRRERGSKPRRWVDKGSQSTGDLMPIH